jgi:hypothetical protein
MRLPLVSALPIEVGLVAESAREVPQELPSASRRSRGSRLRGARNGERLPKGPAGLQEVVVVVAHEGPREVVSQRALLTACRRNGRSGATMAIEGPSLDARRHEQICHSPPFEGALRNDGLDRVVGILARNRPTSSSSPELAGGSTTINRPRLHGSQSWSEAPKSLSDSLWHVRPRLALEANGTAGRSAAMGLRMRLGFSPNSPPGSRSDRTSR